MKVLVTGGAGSVGGWTVRELIRRGHEVTAAGRTPARELPGAAYRQLDCTDWEAVRSAVPDYDAVVHLAAIPSPGRIPSEEIFRINCLGTYHIYEACAAAGLKRLAVASSINALGQLFGVKPLPVRYFPIDEAHPQLCSDPYSFSKKVTEDIAEYFWHKDGISSVALRLPWVVDPVRHRQSIETMSTRDVLNRGVLLNYWTWLDARDAGVALALGIERDYEGAHTLFTMDSENCLGRPSRELAAIGYPEVTEWREPVAGRESLVSIRRAREVLGWEPVYRFKPVCSDLPPPTESDRTRRHRVRRSR